MTNGKGDAPRPIDHERFSANYDLITFEPSTLQPGINVLDPDTGTFTNGVPRVDDAHGMISDAMGVHPDQVAEANRLYGHKGVKFDPETGRAKYRDRAAKLQHLKDRGYYDKNEVRG